MKRVIALFTVLFLSGALTATLLMQAYQAMAAPDEQLNAEVQIIHLAPFAAGDAAVDIDVNGSTAITNLVYAESTGYVSLPSGVDLLVEVYPVGAADPAITATLNLVSGTQYSVSAKGGGNGYPLALEALVDNVPPTPVAGGGNGFVRIGHLAPFDMTPANTAVDVIDDVSNLPVLTNVLYDDITPYLPLPAGEYDLRVDLAGGGPTLFDLVPINVITDTYVAAYAAGDGTNQTPDVYAVPQEGVAGLLPSIVQPEVAQVQVIHLAPFAAGEAAVDIAVNGSVAITDLVYAEATGYVDLPAGVDLLVEVFPVGSGTAAITGTFNLMADTEYSVIATGGTNGYSLELVPLLDNAMPVATPAELNGFVRIGHLAPFDPVIANTAVNIIDDISQTPILTNVVYGDITPYLVLPAGTYDLSIELAADNSTLFDLVPVDVMTDTYVAAYAAGDGVNQTPDVYAVPQDGVAGMLPSIVVQPATAEVQIIHLAPFAPGEASVDVAVNGTVAVPDLIYQESTGYVSLPAGVDLNVEVIPAGATDPAITATLNLVTDTQYSVIAVGGSNGYDLELLVFEDNTLPAAFGGGGDNGYVRIGHLAPFDPMIANTAVNIIDDVSQTAILTNVVYGDVTPYLTLPVGTYDLSIELAADNSTLFDLVPVDVLTDTYVAAYAAGDGVNQTPDVYAVPQDGVSGQLPSLVSPYVIYLPLMAKP